VALVGVKNTLFDWPTNPSHQRNMRFAFLGDRLQLQKHDQNMGIIYNLLLGTVQVPVPAEPRQIRVIHLACGPETKALWNCVILDRFQHAFHQYPVPCT
jgi:hypothetical protein